MGSCRGAAASGERLETRDRLGHGQPTSSELGGAGQVTVQAVEGERLQLAPHNRDRSLYLSVENVYGARSARTQLGRPSHLNGAPLISADQIHSREPSSPAGSQM